MKDNDKGYALYALRVDKALALDFEKKVAPIDPGDAVIALMRSVADGRITIDVKVKNTGELKQ